MVRAAIVAILLPVAVAGCGDGSKPPPNLRVALARCATDARPFADEQARVQRLGYHGKAELDRHLVHALAGLGRVHGETADSLADASPRS